MSNKSPLDDPFNIFLACIGFGILICLPFMIMAAVQTQKHRDYLGSIGCLLQSEYETGKKVYCGKACSRNEKMQVYSCKDGYRYELDGHYVAGVGEKK